MSNFFGKRRNFKFLEDEFGRANQRAMAVGFLVAGVLGHGVSRMGGFSLGYVYVVSYIYIYEYMN